MLKTKSNNFKTRFTVFSHQC